MSFTPAGIVGGAAATAVLRLAAVAVLCLLAATACGSAAGSGASPDAATDQPAPTTATTSAPSGPTTAADSGAGSTPITSTGITASGPVTLGPADRPATLFSPPPATTPAPLLVLLHGYGSNPTEVDRYFDAAGQAGPRGLFVLIPGGQTDQTGKQFWDATAACCNFTGSPVDDVGYIRDLIDQAVAEHPIDPARVYVMGHSNGGFMTYRLACDLADRVTAVAVVSGADAPAADACTPSRPVSVLHLHGDADPLVSYTGGQFTAPFPGAVESVARWAARDGCDATTVAGPPVDLEANMAGAETAVSIHPGCPQGIDVQLDTIQGGGHVPIFIPEAVGTDILDWLLTHTR